MNTDKQNKTGEGNASREELTQGDETILIDGKLIKKREWFSGASPDKNARTWTLELTDRMGNKSYLYRYGNRSVHYCGASETPFALSNIAGNQAAILRMKLEGCESGARALRFAVSHCTYAKTIVRL